MTACPDGALDPVADALDRWLGEHLEQLVSIRRDLHAHPELSGDEHRTTRVVTDIVSAAGYVCRTMSVGTGLIADAGPAASDTSTPESMIAFRSDIDALAMHDLKDVAYRSTVDGVSHACGHDVHTTIGVGAALFLADHPELARHRTRFIFQPAEERVPGGALDVLADGGLDGATAVIGLHCEPKLDVGRIGLRTGSITSAADMITITVRGPGGHTARPELTVDTVGLAARLVSEVPRLVSAATANAEVKLVFGAIHGGDAANVIPTSVQLRASVRTPSLEAWETLEASVRSAIDDVSTGSDADVCIDYTRGVPPTVNDASVVELLRTAASGIVGADRIVEAEQSWGGDDFAWLTREIPGAYVRLGVHDPDGPQLDLHAGQFDVDEGAIDVGIRLLVTAACTRDAIESDS
ncbi:MAG: amidohydrolase [Ilumatobacter sp.]|uniref:amidohydrolase n=1 Tax=Ilumatobacter sp. TaxID=1967498 RepID=UPI003C776E7D